MKYNDFIKEFMNNTPEQVSDIPENIAAALSSAGIAPDEPYYSGALECVKNALNKKGSSEAVKFWEEYQLSLCEQLTRMETDTGRETVRNAIRPVKAVLYAMRL